MAGEPRIIAFGAGSDDSAPETSMHAQAGSERGEELAIDAAWEVDEEAPSPSPSSRRAAVAAVLATLAAVGWSAFFVWSRWPELAAGISPQEVAGLVGGWSGPVLLIGLAWLIVLRTSKREAARFNDAARLLALESGRLERRLVTINSELSLAREFIAAQSRDLESLGRIAAERLSQHAERLDGLIRSNGSQIEAIASVSGTALDNMERLRGNLPVIVSSAKDVTNHIGNAGRAANSQLQDLIDGFNRLNEFGQASERQVAALHDRVEKTLGQLGGQLETIERAAEARFTALDEQGNALRNRLDGQEVEALAAIRRRGAELAEEIEATRRGLDEQEAESLSSLRSRLTAVRDESSAVARALREGEAGALAAYRESLARLDEDLGGAIARLEELDRSANEAAQRRLAELAQAVEQVDGELADRVSRFHDELARRQDEARDNDELAVQSLRERLELLDGEIAQRRAHAAEQEAAELEALRTHLARFDDEVARRHAEHQAHVQTMVERTEVIAGQLDAFAGRMKEIAAHGDEAGASLAATLQTLASHLTGSRGALDGTDHAIAQLTDASVRLLELIQAGATHASEDLPKAIASGEEQLEATQQRLFMLRDVAQEAVGHGQALEQHVFASQERLTGTLGSLDELHDSIAEKTENQAARLDALLRETRSLQESGEAVAERAQSALREAIEQLAASAREAVASIETGAAHAISGVADKLGEESAAALDRVMRVRAAEAAGQLEQAAAHAAGASREAAIQLRDQLAMVNELTGNLERRVAQAREKAQEKIDNDFARRSALITEALNSHAIDIAKALDSDVSDTAWSAYLKGDRGIFSRRAVRLLETGEARSVQQIYETDRDFREHVSRYIHDFESMLRQLLSTRDGHALGVTVLSSDLGKLYVALAQAIERLRD
jgi:uncharacterized phage infection (PIP) family protein YhgE